MCTTLPRTDLGLKLDFALKSSASNLQNLQAGSPKCEPKPMAERPGKIGSAIQTALVRFWCLLDGGCEIQHHGRLDELRRQLAAQIFSDNKRCSESATDLFLVKNQARSGEADSARSVQSVLGLAACTESLQEPLNSRITCRRSEFIASRFSHSPPSSPDRRKSLLETGNQLLRVVQESPPKVDGLSSFRPASQLENCSAGTGRPIRKPWT